MIYSFELVGTGNKKKMQFTQQLRLLLALQFTKQDYSLLV